MTNASLKRWTKCCKTQSEWRTQWTVKSRNLIHLKPRERGFHETSQRARCVFPGVWDDWLPPGTLVERVISTSLHITHLLGSKDARVPSGSDMGTWERELTSSSFATDLWDYLRVRVWNGADTELYPLCQGESISLDRLSFSRQTQLGHIAHVRVGLLKSVQFIGFIHWAQREQGILQ